MERVWVLDGIAISVERIDFLDPAHADEDDVRERGVRLEVRPVVSERAGSIYASATTTLQPGACRIDLLESRPGAADRVHWHPGMHDGEPSERVFDVELSADPLGWLGTRLRDVTELVPSAEPQHVADVRDVADELLDEVARGLAWARQPWPSVTRDDRGLATQTG